MKIHALTVCVDYAEEFAIGLPRWLPGLASWTVITAHRDSDTMGLARTYGLHLLKTDAFYRDGAAFNKGRALEEARVDLVHASWARGAPLGFDDWILLIDADVVPPADWRGRLEGAAAFGYLSGCRRFAGTAAVLEDRGQPDLPGDVPGVGYCQLFHAEDPLVIGVDPLIDCCWTHAGNYDNRLMDRWRRHGRVRTLPFRLAHLGTREHWFGRGHRAEFLAMQAERKRRGGRWDHERIEAPK